MKLYTKSVLEEDTKNNHQMTVKTLHMKVSEINNLDPTLVSLTNLIEVNCACRFSSFLYVIRFRHEFPSYQAFLGTLSQYIPQNLYKGINDSLNYTSGRKYGRQLLFVFFLVLTSRYLPQMSQVQTNVTAFYPYQPYYATQSYRPYFRTLISMSFIQFLRNIRNVPNGYTIVYYSIAYAQQDFLTRK